jgi:hypothetical protein
MHSLCSRHLQSSHRRHIIYIMYLLPIWHLLFCQRHCDPHPVSRGLLLLRPSRKQTYVPRRLLLPCRRLRSDRLPVRVHVQSTGSGSRISVPFRSLLPLFCAERVMSRWHLFLGNRCGADPTSLVIQFITHAYASGQTLESACLPCSSSQSCPPGTSVPTQISEITTAQIISYVCSAIASVFGVLVAIFKVYPFIKARVTMLRKAGIRPTLKRIIFLQKTLTKYQSLLCADDRQNSDAVAVNSMGVFPQDFIASVSQSVDPTPGVSARVVTGTVTSASTQSHAPPALLLLTAVQLGHTVNLLPAAF